jgi:hypothetical protein
MKKIFVKNAKRVELSTSKAATANENTRRQLQRHLDSPRKSTFDMNLKRKGEQNRNEASPNRSSPLPNVYDASVRLIGRLQGIR